MRLNSHIVFLPNSGPAIAVIVFSHDETECRMLSTLHSHFASE